jgi:hypothetical protein
MEAIQPKEDTWVFVPHTAAGALATYKPRAGEIVYSDHSAYSLQWGTAINRDIPLRFVQVQEVYGALVKFTIYEGAKGQVTEVGVHTQTEEKFLSFLRTGSLIING